MKYLTFFGIALFVAVFLNATGLFGAAIPALQIWQGGTGSTSTPSYGQLWVGNNSNGMTLTATSSLGITASETYTGTVTSVDASVPTGLSVSGVPFTTAGTIALTYTAGYAIPTTTRMLNWDLASTHKTTEDALNGLVKVDGSGNYSAVTDSSSNWNTAYTNRITSANYPLSIATNAISTVATSSLNLTVGTFLSPNISQWTNDSVYLTSVASDATWTIHGSYPAACTAGQVVSGIGDTLTCVATSTNANTATALYANGANCSANQYPLGVDASGAVENCTADANTTYTAGDNLTLTGTDFDVDDPFSLTKLTATYASTTGFSTSYASSTLYHGADLQTCNSTTGKLIWTNGVFGCGTDQNTGGTYDGDFTWDTTYGNLSAATSSNLWLQGKLYASSTSIFDGLASFANATSTQLSATNFYLGTDGQLTSFVGSGLSINGNTLTVNGTSSLPNLITVGTTTGITYLNGGQITATTSIGANLFNRTGDWGGTFDGQEGSYYLDFRNLLYTGTSTLPQLTSIGTIATGVWNATAIDEAKIDWVVTGQAVDFGGATSFELPNAASPTVDATGEIAIDTTSGQMKWFDGVQTQLVTGTTTLKFFVGSTTPDSTGKNFNQGTTTFYTSYPEGMTMSVFRCKTDSNSLNVRFGDGTNFTADGKMLPSGIIINTPSNNTWTAWEDMAIQIGSATTSVNGIWCTGVLSKTAD